LGIPLFVLHFAFCILHLFSGFWQSTQSVAGDQDALALVFSGQIVPAAGENGHKRFGNDQLQTKENFVE